ncbi:hypothetical protein ENHYD8BJ_10023 [Enhydrobacter sp. 8BJ]|nr:hypothetical protein [Enhydrobacter sp. 8BJ]VXA93740.1 hypothetical protein ENHYD8BJ_10023 [Enhydrobacter sp. 8BJ]
MTAKLAQAEKENSELKRMIENAKDEAEAKKPTSRKQKQLPLDDQK